MKKSYLFIVFLSIISNLSGAQANWSLTVPLPQKNQALQEKKPKIDAPICYMETANGTILDLSKLCKQQLNDSGIHSNKPSSKLYDRSGMKKFDDELYGEEN